MSTTKSRILVADDHPLVRDGLVLAINSQTDMMVCGEAGSGAEIFKNVEKLQPDAVLMDLFLGQEDGLTVVKNLLGPWPKLRILVVSMQSASVYAQRCWKAGAMGYVSKIEPASEVVAALRSILRGRLHFSADVLASGRNSPESLTDRELHVLKLIGEGLKSSEIAERLGISPRTVDTHRENIKDKLGLATSAQLMRHAMEAGGS